MKISDVKDILAETELPVTYYQWPISQAPAPPYLVWYFPGSENFAADDKVFKRIYTLNVELYTQVKNFLIEMDVEDVFDKYGMVWDKVETYIDDEKMYQVLYTMEVVIDG